MVTKRFALVTIIWLLISIMQQILTDITIQLRKKYTLIADDS